MQLHIVWETAAGFHWDAGNLEKSQKHGVSAAETKGFLCDPMASEWMSSTRLAEERLRAIAKTDQGRYVFLVFTIRERNGERFIRPISARYMHGKEVEYYEKENPGISK